jgi:glycosyltransferase involved in cell wall biosynthesis
MNKISITYFHWAKNNGPSIVRSFRPLIDEIQGIAHVEEYRVPCSGSLPWNMIRNIVFVYKYSNKQGTNHITGDIHYCILGLIGRKSILTIHDDYAIVKARRGIFDKIFKYVFWIYLPIKLADEVICISDTTKDKIDKLFKNKKTKVISHHAMSADFKYVRKDFNIDYPVILQVGTDQQKNLETTFKALAGIKCKLRVLKKMTPEQCHLGQSLGIDYSNVFDISDEEVLKEYIDSDIVVFPSLYEGFGMPIIEGQAIGRVVITSDIEPMRSVSGAAAILLKDPLDIQEYRKVLLRVFRDKPFRERIIFAGLKNVERYRVTVPLAKYLKLYESLFAY